MTKDEIIQMALEADNLADKYWNSCPSDVTWKMCRDERFANLVAATEREQCAKVCETQDAYGDPVRGWFDILASAIRARGNT